MIKYIIKRILQIIPLLLVISFLVFTLMYLSPFDAIDSITTPNMSQETIEHLRESRGLNEPFIVQYFVWLGNVLKGELGNSIISQTSISQELSYRIPNTIILVLPAYVISFSLAIFLGLFAAANKGKFIDKLLDTIASIGIATPTFWFALVLIYIFGYRLSLFPIIGMYTLGQEKSLLDLIQHLFMPTLALVVGIFPSVMRLVRSSAISQLRENYIVVQKSLGARKDEIFYKHVSRNVMLPIATEIGRALPALITGAVITESIFQWPGVGTYFLKAAGRLDYPVVMAVMLLSATLVILGNLIADILYVIIDPRIKGGF